MKKMRVSEIVSDLEKYRFLFLRNLSKPSFGFAYKPIVVLPDCCGCDSGKLLIARYKNCAQRVLGLDSYIYVY